MLWLSEVLIQHPEIETFDDLLPAIKDGARNGEMFFRMDIRPPYTDTPDNWEDRLEAAFTGALR